MHLLTMAGVRGRHRPVGHASDGIFAASSLSRMVNLFTHGPSHGHQQRAATPRDRDRKSRLRQTLVLLAMAGPCASGACAATTTTATSTAPTPAASAAGGLSDTRVTLAIGAPVRLDDGTTVTLRDVTDDSRCPSDATCIWAGDATLTLAVEPRGGRAEIVTLHSGQAEGRSAVAAGVRLTLERLDPEPTAARPVERPHYRAVLAVSK